MHTGLRMLHNEKPAYCMINTNGRKCLTTLAEEIGEGKN